MNRKKKVAVCITVLCVLIAVGVFFVASVLASASLFQEKSYSTKSPELEQKLASSEILKMARGSTNHYYFRSGFREYSTYWSFELPQKNYPDFIKWFISKYNLTKVHDYSKVQLDGLVPPKRYKEFEQKYWFDELPELDEIYKSVDLSNSELWYCGYDIEKQRFYLVNMDF